MQFTISFRVLGEIIKEIVVYGTFRTALCRLEFDRDGRTAAGRPSELRGGTRLSAINRWLPSRLVLKLLYRYT